MEANWTFPGPSHVSEVVRKPPSCLPGPFPMTNLVPFSH